MLLLPIFAARAAVLAGVAWAPAGIGALSWSEADGFSGTLAGEFDGWLRPPLTFHGGWVGERNAVLAGVAVASTGTATFAGSNRRSAAGGVRISGDWRHYLFAREPGRANLYGQAGLYGILPWAEDVDDAYTAEEQADADEGAAGTRARIGGIGAQAGIGAEYLVADGAGRPAVAIGLRYLARIHRGEELEDVGSYSVSTVVLSEAAVVLEIVR